MYHFNKVIRIKWLYSYHPTKCLQWTKLPKFAPSCCYFCFFNWSIYFGMLVYFCYLWPKINVSLSLSKKAHSVLILNSVKALNETEKSCSNPIWPLCCSTTRRVWWRQRCGRSLLLLVPPPPLNVCPSFPLNADVLLTSAVSCCKNVQFRLKIAPFIPAGLPVWPAIHR